MQRKLVQVWGSSRNFEIFSQFSFFNWLNKPLCMNIVVLNGCCFIHSKKLRKVFHKIRTLDSNQSLFRTWVVKAESKIQRQKQSQYSIQRNSRSINLFSIQECNCGICRIEGKLRSAVWTVYVTSQHLAKGLFIIAPCPAMTQTILQILQRFLEGTKCFFDILGSPTSFFHQHSVCVTLYTKTPCDPQ